MDELWAPVKEFPGWYEVSNLGRVRRIKASQGTRKGKILRDKRTGNGYRGLCLRAFGRDNYRYVHELVAEAFVGDRPHGFQINHRDTNKRNNRADNLEYTTPKGNQQHASANDLTAKGSRNGRAKLTEDLVRAIRNDGASSGLSHSAIAQKYRVSRSHVSSLLAGLFWKHIGVTS